MDSKWHHPLTSIQIVFKKSDIMNMSGSWNHLYVYIFIETFGVQIH